VENIDDEIEDRVLRDEKCPVEKMRQAKIVNSTICLFLLLEDEDESLLKENSEAKGEALDEELDDEVKDNEEEDDDEDDDDEDEDVFNEISTSG